MLILVSYDVSTITIEGQRRLRRVAKVCLNYGQRVQKSVFECRVNQALFEKMKTELLDIIDMDEDSLRFYRLNEPLHKNVMEYGKFHAVDFDEPLII